MFGIFFGILCLVALVAVWRGRSQPGCGMGLHFGRGRRSGRRAGAGRHAGFGLYRLFEQLDTSPGQEKAIRSALDELQSSFAALRPRVKEARHGVAVVLDSEAFDSDAAARALDAPLHDVTESRGAVVSAIAKIHEALDRDQRRRLARFLEAFPYRRAF